MDVCDIANLTVIEDLDSVGLQILLDKRFDLSQFKSFS